MTFDLSYNLKKKELYCLFAQLNFRNITYMAYFPNYSQIYMNNFFFIKNLHEYEIRMC